MRKYITNPENFNKELEILYEMGLDNSEIQYLILQKEKDIISQKWN